jgi:hypothetical protein
MLLEYAQRPFERMEHRLSNRRGVAGIQRMPDDYALASDVGPQFGNVTVGSGKMTANHRIEKITQLVRLAALECATLTSELFPVRLLPDLYPWDSISPGTPGARRGFQGVR